MYGIFLHSKYYVSDRNGSRDGECPIPSKHCVTFLLIVLVLLCLLAPKVMEGIASLTHITTSTPAYEGDGILLGDSGTVFPFLNIRWTITQQPMFLDSFHTVSIYAVPLNVARRNIYLYRSNFTANRTFQVQKTGIHSVGERMYVYFLSKDYLNDGQEPSAKINVEVVVEDGSTLLTAPVFQFQSRQTFSNFIDLEPGAVDGAVGCKCMLGQAIKEKCENDDYDCIKRLKIDSGCPLDLCTPSSDGVVWSQTTSYNFFATNVTANSTVRYDTDLLMYFYNTSSVDFEKYYVCTIRGTDSCLLHSKGVFKFSKSWNTRKIIVAYTHPMTIPSLVTTQLVVHAVVKVDQSLVIFLICALIAYLILRHCFHIIGYLRRKKLD